MQALDSSRIFGNWFLIKSKEGEDQNKIRLMFSNNGCSITDISYKNLYSHLHIATYTTMNTVTDCSIRVYFYYI